MLKEYPQLLTWEKFFTQTDAITLDYLLLALIKKGKPCGVALCNEGLIIGDMFSSNPLQSALWYPTVPLTEQPDMTIDFFIRTFEIV